MSETNHETFEELRARLETLLGPKGLVTDPETLAPHLVEQRNLYQGWAPFMVTPADRDEVAAVVRLAAEAGVPIVPQGGNTGLVGGAIPFREDGAILLNPKRLNRIRDLDPVDYSITVEAGCILQSIQEAAAEADRLFPLSLGAEGSCQIGGNLSTNAGGIHVVRYGNMRDLVLGLEVVLPDGQIWDGLKALRKDNTGYDLKQLFIGAEGTLGIITATTLKLFARPREQVSAFVAARDLAATVEILAHARRASGEAVTACELIPRRALDFTLKHGTGVSDPLAAAHDWYLLIEISSGDSAGGLKDIMETMLAQAYEAGLVTDAAIAASEAQAASFWRLREVMVAAQAPEGASIKHDVSVPVSQVPAFITKASSAVEALIPGIRPYPFGHIGDGNVHFNLTQPLGADGAAFLARWDEVNHLVHEIAVGFGGSISAEHGLGRMKVAENAHFKSAVELDLMRKIKAAIDPRGLMNPGKVITPA
jgi:D-lactate dehydrogenase (cytochrome)